MRKWTRQKRWIAGAATSTLYNINAYMCVCAQNQKNERKTLSKAKSPKIYRIIGFNGFLCTNLMGMCIVRHLSLPLTLVVRVWPVYGLHCIALDVNNAVCIMPQLLTKNSLPLPGSPHLPLAHAINRPLACIWFNFASPYNYFYYYVFFCVW